MTKETLDITELSEFKSKVGGFWQITRWTSSWLVQFFPGPPSAAGIVISGEGQTYEAAYTSVIDQLKSTSFSW